MTVVANLKPEQSVKGCYLCKFKQILKNKNGKDYCTVRLQDKTGTIDGKIWSFHSSILPFEVDDVVYVEGEVILYQENLQFNINKMQKAEEGTYELTDFIPQTPKDPIKLEERLFALIDSVQNVYIKKLLENIFYDEKQHDAFIMHSAAKSIHHAYLNGLLEHTVTVAEIGTALATQYTCEKDLVTAGCLLHDIGKLRELSDFPKNDYTDEGQLLGHIVMGSEMIHDEAAQIADFPHEIENLLKHIILAHHGEYEYASPKRPKCIEAMIVHLADYSDSKLKMFEEMVQSANEEEGFIGYHKILNRNIRKVKL